jgi:hypothetical protein
LGWCTSDSQRGHLSAASFTRPVENQKTAQFSCCNVSARPAYFLPMATEPDFYIATFDTGARPHPWRWELRRRSSPMGVKVGRSGYQSQASAEFAGKQALEEFLAALAKEEKYRR